MKKVLTTLLGSILFCSSLFAGKQNNVILRGSARDASGEPAAYALSIIKL